LRLERNLSVLVEHLSSLNHYALKLKKTVTTHLVQQWYAHVYLPALAVQRALEPDDNFAPIATPSMAGDAVLFEALM
jgi:hypothetical protein